MLSPPSALPAAASEARWSSAAGSAGNMAAAAAREEGAGTAAWGGGSEADLLIAHLRVEPQKKIKKQSKQYTILHFALT